MGVEIPTIGARDLLIYRLAGLRLASFGHDFDAYGCGRGYGYIAGEGRGNGQGSYYHFGSGDLCNVVNGDGYGIGFYADNGGDGSGSGDLYSHEI